MSTSIITFTKKQAISINGGLTATSKMPCKSYSLPTIACNVGYQMAQVKGSICSACYANKGFYKMYENNILPVQMARLDSIVDPDWVSSMVSSIGTDSYFRWHDSGDLQNMDHFEKIVQVCLETPNCAHWLPTREYKLIGDYIKSGKAIPSNLTVRLSAMYPDIPVTIPKALQGIKGITSSNVHTHGKEVTGSACTAPSQNGECRDCRKCWTDTPVSYALH